MHVAEGRFSLSSCAHPIMKTSAKFTKFLSSFRQPRHAFQPHPRTAIAAAVGMLLMTPAAFADSFFVPGNLVVSVEGNGVAGATSGPYRDNQAAPMTLFQYKTSGTSSASYVNSLTLPQSNSGKNYAVSSEYGSSSEGALQLSGNGKYLSIMGYGINAATFNSNPGKYSPDPTNAALAQSGSVQGQSYTAVPRVVALIDASGNVDSSTALYGFASGNNPRSVYTPDGKTLYVSGQGTKGDSTGGVFVTSVGSQSVTPVTGNDAGGGSAQDTRFVTAYNGQLYVSADSKSGATNRDFIGTLGNNASLPTGLVNNGNGPTQLPGFGNSGGTGKVSITAATTNGINAPGLQINLSPTSFFFANDTTLYVADSGMPKQTSASSGLGDGGLQKWSLINGLWQLDYTLSAGLNLVSNKSSSGSTGLLALTGRTVTVNGIDQEEIYAINYTIGDLDPTYLFGVTDLLAATSKPSGESFVQLAAAPVDSNFKGVAFAPTGDVPEPASLALFLTAGLGLLVARRKQR